MKTQKEVLQQYVSDMLAVDKHIHEAVRRQRDDSQTSEYPDAHQLLSRLEATLDQLIDDLEHHLEFLGGEATSPVKDAVTSVLGAFAGMYDKVRSSTVSKMLRDTYTALGLTAISYTMLHTTGLALQEPRTAGIALRHLTDITPFIAEISRIIPPIVVHELLEDEEVDIDATVGPEAVRATQQAWSSLNINQPVYA